MKDIKDYFFKPTERINGLIYIKDGDDNFVVADGKVKKFKSTTACAEFIHNLEMARDFKLMREENKVEENS